MLSPGLTFNGRSQPPRPREGIFPAAAGMCEGTPMSSRCTPRARATFSVVVALLAAVVGARPARANFVLLSQSLTLDRGDGRADFTLTFNQSPDFTTTDRFGRQADSFQIEF